MERKERRVFTFGDPPIRKHLSHLKRLRDHLVLLCDNVPPLPESDGDPRALELVEAFFEFAVTGLPEERSKDVEVIRFVASSVPDEDVWKNAPKVRKITADVEILSASQLRFLVFTFFFSLL